MKYIKYPDRFDPLQFTRVLSKANNIAFDTRNYWMYRKNGEETISNRYYDCYLRDSEAFYFGCNLLNYKPKAIFDTLRIGRKLESNGFTYYDEADIYVLLTN